jgi:hypothetical protein
MSCAAIRVLHSVSECMKYICDPCCRMNRACLSSQTEQSASETSSVSVTVAVIRISVRQYGRKSSPLPAAVLFDLDVYGGAE